MPKETQHKMVYYQSTPMVIKTEKPSQAQLCAQLETTTTISETTTNVETSSPLTHIPHEYQLQQSTSNAYADICSKATIMQKRSHESPPLSHTSIIPSYTVSIPVHNLSTNTANISLHANIKTEPNIGVYGGSSSATSAYSTATTLDLNTGTASVSAPAVAISRKPTVNKPQFKCEQCGMTFGSKSAHTSHTKSHAKSIDLSGGIAAGSARLSDVSEAGVSTGIPKTPNVTGIAGGDPYQCNVCQKTFAVPARLIRHYRTHTGERPFECEFCHKLFSVKENLQVHRRIHTKERPYKCDVCERAFEHSGKLHRHMRIHTGERPHKCSVCEKTFIQSGQLVIHMRTHTGEKPYKCPVEGCGKGFTCSKQLKVHSRTHTGEKPYHCDICFRDFGYNHVLKLHRVQHYGSKCYKCTICDETFKNKKEMEAHIKGHAKEFPDDDDEAVAGAAVAGSSSTSNSSSGEAISAPGSPLSPIPSGSAVAKARKSKVERARALPLKTTASSLRNPASPSSPRSTLSPSSSRLSAGSPEYLTTSSPTPYTMEIDYLSRDGEVASTSNDHQLSLSLPVVNSNGNNEQQSCNSINEELPTDLSKQQVQHPTPMKFYQSGQMQNVSPAYNYQQLQHQGMKLERSGIEPPTINPALLEAASIVRRRDMLDSPNEEEVKKTETSVKQSRYSEQQSVLQQKHTPTLTDTPTTSYAQQRISLSHDLSQYDDTREANELIEHYKRGELAQHGMHKGYVPVPKFEPSLLNNEIVRQVEAAIAPLRSSTESPERSSSPESDSMMMADRDVMTLPLRKRKLYMREGSPIGGKAIHDAAREINKSLTHIGTTSANGDSNQAHSTAINANNETGTKVMRMNSVIQFAKAS
ncbi:Krueppel homolog 1 isoform X2 [Anastrepha ludens]|uniref:Krueppel homolog 1 isoform X2 n=1 Tax=Anastrepha ludens TaxID=28586 RepID=UPI0023AE8581|nr:Krueppel homolog 1 isoform X2 [Anastrepha ludens]